jgi:predicted molibdopterin-dependent oxidoreductase YjgC
MSCDSAEDVFEEMRGLTPSYGGITYARIDQGGIQWPCPDEEHPGTTYLHKDGFSRGKGLFHAVEHTPPAESPDDDYPLMLTTGRVLYQCHAATMTGRCEGLEFFYPKGCMEIHQRDASALGVKDREVVRVSSRKGSIEITAQVTDRSMPGSVFIPFHFFEESANRLTHAEADPIGTIPAFRVCAVKVEPLSA